MDIMVAKDGLHLQPCDIPALHSHRVLISQPCTIFNTVVVFFLLEYQSTNSCHMGLSGLRSTVLGFKPRTLGSTTELHPQFFMPYQISLLSILEFLFSQQILLPPPLTSLFFLSQGQNYSQQNSIKSWTWT